MESISVKDYMNPRPVTFGPEMGIEQAINRLLESGLTGGPVVDAQGKLVGFLSEQDCLAQGLSASYHCEQMAQVSELMRPEVLTVRPDTSIIELAQQMTQQKPKIYPVIDDGGRLIGTITRRDVLRAIQANLRSCFVHGKANQPR
ncbi:CBS domain-containing protein [Pseudaeromonas paramecii]|uniref:CBS domain-containing protein n=1 Tax=Pseudaeromonas paramecii TaxID=2138166 RepID=A0ABP8Q7D3_9GAMM